MITVTGASKSYGDFAALDDAGEHPALVRELRAQPLAQRVHLLARIANHRDLEERLAHANALADRPLLHVVAFDGQVLPRRAGIDTDRVEVLLGDEEHLALRRVCVGAALEPAAHDRFPSFVRVHRGRAAAG